MSYRVQGSGSTLLKGGLYRGVSRGVYLGFVKGDNRSLDYSTC